jgi:hypothetical protein
MENICKHNAAGKVEIHLRLETCHFCPLLRFNVGIMLDIQEDLNDTEILAGRFWPNFMKNKSVYFYRSLKVRYLYGQQVFIGQTWKII